MLVTSESVEIVVGSRVGTGSLCLISLS